MMKCLILIIKALILKTIAHGSSTKVGVGVSQKIGKVGNGRKNGEGFEG
jgi:hypothetical protein